MDRLGELQTLVAIVDTGSLAGAARRLNRSPPSISRDLADLERRAGAALVERSTRSCRPTPAGIRLAEDARPLIASYAEAVGHAAGDAGEPRGLVRITAPITFGVSFVAPLITRFLDAHPGVTIDLQLLDRVVDLIEEDFDLAVRIGRLEDSSLIARPVGQLRRVLAASPAYLEANGVPAHPDELVQHEVVQHGSRSADTVLAFRAESGRTIEVRPRARFTVNQPEAAIAAAREGRGIVRALSHQVSADMRNGRLHRILEEFEPEPLPVNCVWPQSRRSWRRVRLLVDHLVSGLAALDVW